MSEQDLALTCLHYKPFEKKVSKGENALNSLPNNKNLDMTKLKAFEDHKIDVVQMMISVFDRVENIVEKGENASYQHFVFFP